MKILAIDPGDLISAYCVFDCSKFKLLEHDLDDNEKLLKLFRSSRFPKFDGVVIEGIFSYGMPVGSSIIHTCYFIGKLMYLFEMQKKFIEVVGRKKIVTFICGTATGGDKHIKAALKERFNFALPRTVRRDIWSALAVATYYSDKRYIEEQQKILEFWH